MLKDILLVMASMVFFADPVSPLQAFGYSIALGGLMFYKLGSDKIKAHFAEGGRVWAEYGVRHPVVRKLIVFGCVLLGMFVLVASLAPRISPEYDPTAYAHKSLEGLLGEGKEAAKGQ